MGEEYLLYYDTTDHRWALAADLGDGLEPWILGPEELDRDAEAGAVMMAGTALMRELAERVGLLAEYSVAVDGLRRRGGGHDPGQVLVDLAVTLADGGEAIADIAGLADQPALHGPVASPTPASRVLAGVGHARPACLRRARAAARERAWLARAEVTRADAAASSRRGPVLGLVVLDIDATRQTRRAGQVLRLGPCWGGTKSRLLALEGLFGTAATRLIHGAG